MPTPDWDNERESGSNSDCSWREVYSNQGVSTDIQEAVYSDEGVGSSDDRNDLADLSDF